MPVAMVTALCLSLIAFQNCPDLKVGANPLGVVVKVDDKAILKIRRTNSGTNEVCDVRMFGVRTPNDPKNLKAMVQFMRKKIVGREVSFRVLSRGMWDIYANVIDNKMPPEAYLNFAIVGRGLADITSNDILFVRARNRAMNAKLGIWKSSKLGGG